MQSPFSTGDHSTNADHKNATAPLKHIFVSQNRGGLGHKFSEIIPIERYLSKARLPPQTWQRQLPGSDGREARWDVTEHLPKSLPVPKHYPHEPALVLLVHSDTFEHGYLWVRHPEACEIHASFGLLSSHHKIAAIARSGGKALRAHPTPAGTSKHKPLLPCSPSSCTLCLSPCTLAFGLHQAQGPQTPAKASLF